jgi:hypothetical protein
MINREFPAKEIDTARLLKTRNTKKNSIVDLTLNLTLLILYLFPNKETNIFAETLE